MYQEVRTAVVERRLAPGAKLGEEALASVFRVSRARVRQVLHRLAHDGVIELRPNRGAYVAQLSAGEAREVFTARRIVEAHIVETVAKGLTRRRHRELRDHVAAELAAHQRRDRGAEIRLSGEFHLLLARIGGNQVLTRFLEELVSRTSLVIALYDTPGAPCCHTQEHAALAELVVAGRVQAATDLMGTHLLGIEARLDLDRPARHSVDLRTVFPTRGAIPR